MLKFLLVLTGIFYSLFVPAQSPKTYTSSEILLQLKKLNVLGSVLYIAAHPDDENTRLLAYLASEKLYRAGYLSLTRGDGGQNLIGDEQGIDLGLIRTQELLAARRIDGAEQFFSRAYDFGFCKTSDEALQTWGHDKILSDVVWVIRKFKPDVIITRFPPDSRAGHGHHAASAILAAEAFDAAADDSRFPEQLIKGVSVWQAKRLLWNTFNFGNTNTQSEDQYKLDVGAYNPLLGKGYGEIAALSRSQHKSQGFGVPAQRGSVIEYFSTIKGDMPVNDLMDGVDVSWNRIAGKSMSDSLKNIIDRFDLAAPSSSLKGLVTIYKAIGRLKDGYWKQQKMKELQNVIENCSGLFLEATAGSQYAVQGDSIKLTTTVNNRMGQDIKNVTAHFYDSSISFSATGKNVNLSNAKTFYVPSSQKITQPYWLENPMAKGSFTVNDQQLIGKAENDPLAVDFTVNIAGTDFTITKPIRYKYTDPVKGELYQPVNIIPAADLRFEKDVYLFKENSLLHAVLKVIPDRNISGNISVATSIRDRAGANINSKVFPVKSLTKDQPAVFNVEAPKSGSQDVFSTLYSSLSDADKNTVYSNSYKRIISYDHIPMIVYQKEATTKSIYLDFKIDGKLVGYVPGAGDKVPQALQEMGYTVVILTEHDLEAKNLKQFDAIITGVRAYNTNEWMNNVYDDLMAYVQDGGVLLVQYNTSNQVGPVRAKIAPYPFSISRNRVTDEEAPVTFLLPGHPVLNYPNKITSKDFEGWVQERSIYNAEKADSNYQRILSMKDPGEPDQDGSLIVANYGKGRFVYTGLVFFRELPAGVPGAYRLFANLIASPAKPMPAVSGRDVKAKAVSTRLTRKKD